MILDIEDKANPKLVSLLRLPSALPRLHPHAGAAVRSRPAGGGRRGNRRRGHRLAEAVWMVDVRKETKPIDHLDLADARDFDDLHRIGGRIGAHNIHENEPNPGSAKLNNTMVATWFSAGLRVYDIRNPFRPEEIAGFLPDTGGPARLPDQRRVRRLSGASSTPWTAPGAACTCWSTPASSRSTKAVRERPTTATKGDRPCLSPVMSPAGGSPPRASSPWAWAGRGPGLPRSCGRVHRAASAPGGGATSSQRLFNKYAEPIVGQRAADRNKPGAGGVIGWAETGARRARRLHARRSSRRRERDPGALARPKQTGYTLDQFKMSASTRSSPTCCWSARTAEFKTFKDLDRVRQGEPKKIKVANTGTLGADFMTTLLIENAAGMRDHPDPVHSGAQALQARSPARPTRWSQRLFAVAQQGTMRTLGIASPERDPNIPDIPTFKEHGFDVVSERYRVLGGPPGCRTRSSATGPTICEQVTSNPRSSWRR